MNMVAQIARNGETSDVPISAIGGVTTWRDAAEFMALGAGNVQVCTAAMTYGFKIVEEMISGLSQWMDEKSYSSVDQFVGRAVPKVIDWQYLNLNYVTKARINQDDCIKCGRCYAACEDTSHQAITMSEDRVFDVRDDECVACNLCINVCAASQWRHWRLAQWMNALAHLSLPIMAIGRPIRTTQWRGRRNSRP